LAPRHAIGPGRLIEEFRDPRPVVEHYSDTVRGGLDGRLGQPASRLRDLADLDRGSRGTGSNTPTEQKGRPTHPVLLFSAGIQIIAVCYKCPCRQSSGLDRSVLGCGFIHSL